MKKIICLCCITVFVAAVPYAEPSGTEHLTGTWIAEVEHNRSVDTYRIALSADGRCTVRLSNSSAEQETTGNWSWDGTMFRLNATFRNARITYQNNIQWTSVLTFVDGGNSFNILGRAAAGGPQLRITFFKQENSLYFEEKAAPRIFNTLAEHIPSGSRIALVGITAPDTSEGNYYLNELTLQFVNSRRYTVVDRNDIDAVLSEQNFQMSGYIDDETFVSIGSFIGATVVITGNISGTGSQKRLVVKAINVLTSQILAMSSVSL